LQTRHPTKKKTIDPAIRKLETDPRMGKNLRGNLRGKWSIRNGDYRVIYVIDEKEKTVLLYDVRHRKKVYE
jgi:mRNA interferase RelE/StbE